jgi:hypothetical protein
MASVARRKRQMVDGLVELHLANFNAGDAELVMGEAGLRCCYIGTASEPRKLKAEALSRLSLMP